MSEINLTKEFNVANQASSVSSTCRKSIKVTVLYSPYSTLSHIALTKYDDGEQAKAAQILLEVWKIFAIDL